jgi:hypothetical protein
MAAWLVPLLAAGAFAAALLTVVLALFAWRSGSSSERSLRAIRAELDQLSHLHTSARQRRLEIASEALGATLRYAVLIKQAGETPIDRAWSDVGPAERRFEQAWDQASVYLEDERVPTLMERLWQLKETRRRDQQTGPATESRVSHADRKPRLLTSSSWRRWTTSSGRSRRSSDRCSPPARSRR